MDIEDWELLPDEGFLEIHDDVGGNKIHPMGNTVSHTNYFICPSKIHSVHVLEPRITKNPPDQESAIPTPPDPVSQVLFKKMKETEFVDIKVDSPRGIIPQIEGAAVFQFEKDDQEAVPCDISEMEIKEDDGRGLNIWKWIGVTVCSIIVFSSSCRMSDKHPRQNQKLQSQTYANDKRIKQGGNHASRLREAICAVRGVPIAKARITFGGHYDAAV